MAEADTPNQKQRIGGGPEEDRSFDAKHGAQGAPNGAPRDRGSREGDPDADSVMPGREFGAGGQVDDGPDETAGAGTGGG
ncbi:hypothetical protein [Phenylobacterium sp.]|jgi:hypothetical protein|uniref:hypothetical protein n=1 Tax=Phenylobacterium sp. TaxID=1871053 RepID=UPI002F959578